MIEDYLACLNGPQREAVLDYDHHLLVLAGAGSGKTRVITTKIVHAIRQMGFAPWQILAVTFTNKAAKEMRGRVEAMLGDGYDISSLEMKTFHSYGAGLLRRNAARIGYTSSFNIYDDSDSQSLMASLFPDDSRQIIREYCRRISLLKDKGILPDQESRELDMAEEQLPGLRMHFRMYQKSLQANQCMDFSDLILRANGLLETDEEVREHLHRRYRLILVDEYQDSNGSQFEMLHSLVGDRTQLVVVGDDDQSIYRFRGAEIGNILHFSDDYQNVRTIKLEENYRSTKSIIALASNLISHNRTRHEKTLFTNNEEGARPRLLNCYNESDEALQIASIILKDLGRKDTAILFRTNAQSRAFETTLSGLKVAYQLVGALRFYEREEIKDMLSVFSLMINPHDSVSYQRVINKPARGIGRQSVQKILSLDGDTIRATRNAIESGILTKGALKGAGDFVAAYDEAMSMLSKGAQLGEVANCCIHRFGFWDHYSAESDIATRRTRMENLNALVTAIGEFPPSIEGLASFLESITLDSSAIPGDEGTQRISPDKSVVKLITMHNTKGLEFDTVFVTGLEDDIIPGNRSGQSDADVEEERRIFYVAVTRARKELYLSWAKGRQQWGQFALQYPTRFLRDIPSDCYEGSLVDSRTVTHSASSYTNRYGWTSRSSQAAHGTGNIFPEPPAKSVERKRNDTKFSVGDSVMSPDYGRGSIVSCDVRGDKTIIRVSYDSGRKAIYNTAFCNLRKVVDEDR